VSAGNVCEVIFVSVMEWEVDCKNLEVLFMGYKTDYPEVLHDFLESVPVCACYKAWNVVKTASALSTSLLTEHSIGSSDIARKKQ
jgi:hypothetical protein